MKSKFVKKDKEIATSLVLLLISRKKLKTKNRKIKDILEISKLTVLFC